MEIFLILIIFFIGTVFGSFFTLAVYRIPLGKNITHERSFCTTCGHRLEFKDLIPVFSYIFLKGKCRYCKEKVRPRYLILEILSGIVFVLAFISMKINFLDISYLYLGINQNKTVEKLINLLAFIFFYITNALIIGIDKEYKQINSKVLLFGVITQTLYILYLYMFTKINIYRYGIYILIILILFLIKKIIKKEETNYLIQNLIYITYIASFINNLQILIILIILAIIKTIINSKTSKTRPIGFYIGIITIIVALIQNYITNY